MNKLKIKSVLQIIITFDRNHVKNAQSLFKNITNFNMISDRSHSDSKDFNHNTLV
jgi:hypothetical protein